MGNFNFLLEAFLTNYQIYDNKAYDISEKWVNLLLIHSSLRNLSYIYSQTPKSWVYFFVIIIRPSQAIQIGYFSIFGLVFAIYHLFCILMPTLIGNTLLSSINTLLKVSLLNIVLEQFQDLFGYIIGSVLLLFQIFEYFFIQWTLNVNQKNFQLVRISFSRTIKFLLDIFLIIAYKFRFNIILIQIISMTNSLVDSFIILTEKSDLNLLIKSIILSIQLLTIYLGIAQFIKYENSYTLILVPFFFKIAFGIRKNKSNLNSKDHIVQASIFLKQKKFYECFMILLKYKESNLLRQIKLKLILQQAVNEFNFVINKNFQTPTIQKDLVMKLIQNDSLNQAISLEINQIIKCKIDLLQNWYQNSIQDILIFIRKIINTKQKLDSFYYRQSLKCNQSLILFFYAEILNDIIQANEILTHVKKITNAAIKESFLYKKTQYMKIKFLDSQYMIESISSNAPQQYKKKLLNELIPQGVREHHDELIQNYLTTGQSKFSRNFSKNYIQKDGFIESINLAIQIIYTHQIQFISLFTKNAKQNNVFIIITNENFELKSMSEYSNQIPFLDKVFKLGIYVNKIINQLNSVSQSCLIESSLYYSHPIIKSRQSFYNETSEQMNYFCDINVTVKIINDAPTYYILELENFRNFLTTKKETQVQTYTSFVSVKGLNNCDEVDQNEALLIPYQSDEQIKKFDVDLHQLITSRDEDLYFLHNDIDKNQLAFDKSNTIHEQQLNDEYEQEEFMIDVKSQGSSIEQLRQSKFIRKYSLINRFNNHLPLKKQQQILILLFILCSIISIIFIIIELLSLNLIGFASDINLLEIKNLFFQPLDLFLATRWNLWTYNYEKQNAIITQEEYNELSKFSISNLGEGYNQLNFNMQSVLFKYDLQNLLQNKILSVFQQTDTFKNEKYNMTLRSAISILLNFQYILKMNYVYEKTVKADSPQIFYSFKNYPLLRDILTELNEDIMIATIARGQEFETKLITFFICQQVILFMIILLIFGLKRYTTKKLQLFLSLTSYVEDNYLQKEIQKQKALLSLLQEDRTKLFFYKFNLFEKEASFIQKRTDKTTENQKTHRIIDQNRLPIIQFTIFLGLFYILIQASSVVNYLQYMNYLKKYPQTAAYKKQLSDLSGDIPLMFAQREVLYGRKNYMYLDSAYFDTIFKYVQESLNQTIAFSSSNLDFSKILMSEKFEKFYNEILIENLCQFLPEYLIEKSKQLCPITMSGNMKRGLKIMLVYISSLIETDMAINNFTYRARPTSNELEGAYMISEIINVINKSFYDDLIDITTSLVEQQMTFNILYLLVLFGVLIVILTMIRPCMYKNSRNIIQLIYLIPEYTLYNDEAFERTLRLLINL
ncbi:unnamed protein product [Paramecium sonneborni]|uniref:Transmembrane protein n=1 Tax=Paramecium sonneborni TaxID=65129 RepID=A0A8S1PAI1_9CILI|nr:unnamed protein product [Paramecium sonneborni]